MGKIITIAGIANPVGLADGFGGLCDTALLELGAGQANLSRSQIAGELSVSRNTVNVHIGSIYAKLTNLSGEVSRTAISRGRLRVLGPASVPHYGTLLPARLRLPAERLHRLCWVPVMRGLVTGPGGATV